MRLRSKLVHGVQAVAEGGILALIVVGLVSGAALASGGPNKTSTSTISMVVVGTAGVTAAATVQATYGDTVTFDVSTDATASPYVNLLCYQNGTLVAQGWAGFFDGALGDGTFRLYSPQWTSGAADCTANLDMKSNNKWKVLATTSFHVSA